MSCCQPISLPVTGTRWARSLMCGACPRREGTRCGVSSQETLTHRLAGHCPRGRFPDAAGRIRWAGVTWSGVPMPLRLWWMLRTGRAVDVGEWPGCGCVRPLKAWVKRWKRC